MTYCCKPAILDRRDKLTPEHLFSNPFWDCLATELRIHCFPNEILHRGSFIIIHTSFFTVVFQACFLLWTASCALGLFSRISTNACLNVKRNEPLWSFCFYPFFTHSPKLLFMCKILENAVFIPLISFKEKKPYCNKCLVVFHRGQSLVLYCFPCNINVNTNSMYTAPLVIISYIIG